MKDNAINRFSVPTNGFRSKGESDFADWLTLWKIPFLYEPETFAVGDQWYIPDFILPDGEIIVEVKPALFASELWKIQLLASHLSSHNFGRECWVVEMRWSPEERKQVPIPSDRFVPIVGQESGWDGTKMDWMYCLNCLRPFPFHHLTKFSPHPFHYLLMACSHCKFVDTHSDYYGNEGYSRDPQGAPTRSISDCQADSSEIDDMLRENFPYLPY